MKPPQTIRPNLIVRGNRDANNDFLLFSHFKKQTCRERKKKRKNAAEVKEGRREGPPHPYRRREQRSLQAQEMQPRMQKVLPCQPPRKVVHRSHQRPAHLQDFRRAVHRLWSVCKEVSVPGH